MIDYSDNGGTFEGFSMFSSIVTDGDFLDVFPNPGDDASLPMLVDDYSCVGGFDNFVYDESLQLPSLEQPWNEEEGTKEVDHALPPLFEFDRELSIFHLLKAYGEATRNASAELARVISVRLHEKSSPVGTTFERLGHYLLPCESDPEVEFLNRESIKSYPLALQAFYEITPYGRFAHFVANASIHDSVPRDIVLIHIVDFDIGEGIQWPPLLAALGPHRSVRITSCTDVNEESYRFERTKESLLRFAQTMRLDLRVDRMSMEDLIVEKRMVMMREWLVFNCMVGLPHMGRASKKVLSQMEEFTKVANELIASSGRRGVTTYGIGHRLETKPFSDKHLLHSHALFESMEWHFPSQLSLARTAMECLFVGPCVSGEEECGFGPIGNGLGGLVLSKQNLLEAKEIVRRGGDQQYGLKVGEDGKNGNELVLEWRGTPLVRVCTWK